MSELFEPAHDNTCNKTCVTSKDQPLHSRITRVLVYHHDLVNPYNVAVSRIVSDVYANDEP